MPDPHAKPEQDSSVLTDHGWKVVLLNDDVTPFDIVVLGLQKACALSEEVAEMIATEAQNQGSAVARRGLTQEDADGICVKLRAVTRIPRLCPGVGCSAEQED